MRLANYRDKYSGFTDSFMMMSCFMMFPFMILEVVNELLLLTESHERKKNKN